jgi:small subunit ribosomal protein S14
MAKTCMRERNDKRKALNNQKRARRAKLKAIIMDREATMEERFVAQMKLSELPRNSSRVRQRNRCELTGRPRGYYRKFKMCRNKLRELGSFGMLPGLIKASW